MKVISAIYFDEKRNAGPKAPKDVNEILKNKYGARIYSCLRTGKYKYKIFIQIIKSRFTNEITILQYPLLGKKITYLFAKKKKTILFIHDIWSIKKRDINKANYEIDIFKHFKYIVVHNERMKRYLINNGINEKNIYVLDFFDYLTNKIPKKQLIRKDDTNNLKVIFAGNLKPSKAKFLYQIEKNKVKFKLNLYGLGFDNNLLKIDKKDNIKYCDSFEPDDLSNINGNLGLVWDGDYNESDENEDYKYYTKFNNPHKLSCYLAMNMPVIAWRKSAIAEQIKKYNIGYLISNIYDINNIDFSDYEEKRKNAEKIGENIRKGYYTQRVIDEIINDMKNEKRVKK